MATLKTVLPKANNTFDFSGIETYPYDEDYEYIGLGFNIKMVGGIYEEVAIYVNGAHGGDTHFINSSTYRAIYLPKHYTELGGDLSNAVITALAYVGGGSSKAVPITISEAYIIRDYVEPAVTYFTSVDLYVNKYSELNFRGNKFCTGVAGSVDGGGSFRVQAVPGSIVIGTGDYDTTGTILVPPGCFKEGSNTGRIRGINHTKDETEGKDRTYGTATILPTAVTQFKFENTKPSKDQPITCTWKTSPQQFKYQIKYKPQNGTEVVLDEISQTSEIHTFPTSALPEGPIVVSVRSFDGAYWSDWVSISITTYSHKVTSLEPNGVAQFKDADITATWESSDPQTQYEFKYTKNGVYQPTITGTTAKAHLFPKDTFGVETVTMQLRTHNGYVWSDWKTVSFVTFGTPLTPVLTTPLTYETAFPRITWTSQGQVGYQLQLLKGGALAIDSGEVVNTNPYHDVTSPLLNNTEYVARLRIRNQYGYWSAWTAKPFNIAFIELQKPTISAFSNASISAIILDINNVDDPQFKECDIYRRSDGEWIRIAKGLPKTTRYTDYSVRSDVLYEYYIRAISTLGGYKDGDTVNARVNVYQAQLLNVATNEVIALTLSTKIEESMKREVVRRKFHGRVAESKAFGDSKYKIVTVNGDALKSEKIQLENMDDTAIWLLRNDDGFKLYGTISNLSYSPMMGTVHKISFQFDQANYSEGV